VNNAFGLNFGVEIIHIRHPNPAGGILRQIAIIAVREVDRHVVAYQDGIATVLINLLKAELRLVELDRLIHIE
jgi:hypothetical protein